MTKPMCVFLGEGLARYHFGADHPFGPMRYGAFLNEFRHRGLDARVHVADAVQAGDEDILLFHTPEYLQKVKTLSEQGYGLLDYGDTPAMPGIYEAAATVVGTTLAAVDAVMTGECRRAFTPIAGLHHARRNEAAGFCVFNDPAIAIEHLRARHGISRIAYVDIDAHHGDGIYYSFADDPELRIVDFHEDGRFLYPGSGAITETGDGAAKGTKLNVPLLPETGDDFALKLWETCESFIRKSQPEFILLQCGADSLADDPITHLQLTRAFHAHVTRRLCVLADELCDGRLVAMGGGGYDLTNLANAWNDVVEAMLDGG